MKIVRTLKESEIQRQVSKRLQKYAALSVLERFAMFMGTAQILEVGLKHLLVWRYKFDSKRISRWTLGTTVVSLKEAGLRKDFSLLLESVVTYRNHIAHDLLANEAFLRAFLGGDGGMLELGILAKGIYELEQVMFLYGWCEKNNAWD